MQVIALMLFWIVVLVVATGLVIVSFVMPLASSSYENARALRAGVIRSVAGMLALQVLSLPPFVVLLVANWTLQYVARRLGAGEAAIWIALPIGLLALAIPPLATLAGAYLGFRAGWINAKGQDPSVALVDDSVARCLQRLGPASPLRW